MLLLIADGASNVCDKGDFMMSRDDLMKPDLLSEILLVGSAMIFLLVFVALGIAGLVHSAHLQ
jgi:hypothetical protein